MQSNTSLKIKAMGINNSLGGSLTSNIQPALRHKRKTKIQEEDNSRHARAVAAASAAAAEAAAVAAQAAAEVMRLTGYASTSNHQYSNTPFEEFCFAQAERAATLIQSAYRGHLARQALRALKALVNLQAVVRGHLVRKQARVSLQCMQALVRLQARVRARQVKAAQEASETQIPSLHLLQPLSIDTPPSHHRRPRSSFRNDRLPSVATPFLHRLDQNIHPHSHSRPLDTSRASSFISSEESRDWDSSALSKEQIESKALKKQHALMVRQRALSYAENNQRTPMRSLGTPTRKTSNEYYQSQMRAGKLSFNETEPENLHRDWSWLEGWMAAHGAASVWESNAAALWESRDEGRELAGVEDENDSVLYGHLHGSHHDGAEGHFTSSLFHDHMNSDDDPAIKIIEMDRIASPPARFTASTLSYSPSTSSFLQHSNNHPHVMIPNSRLHHESTLVTSSRLASNNLQL